MAISVQLPPVDLSVNFDELADFRDDLRLNPGGIYAFYNVDDTCLYVGKSKVLYTRLNSHKRSEFADEIDYVEIRYVDNPTDRDIYETYAISEFTPLYNRDKLPAKVPSKAITARIDDLYCDLAHVQTLKGDVEEFIHDLTLRMRLPGRRRHINVDPDDTSLSGAFEDYIEEMAVFNAELPALEDELRGLESELDELIEEESGILRKISDLYESLIV